MEVVSSSGLFSVDIDCLIRYIEGMLYPSIRVSDYYDGYGVLLESDKEGLALRGLERIYGELGSVYGLAGDFLRVDVIDGYRVVLNLKGCSFIVSDGGVYGSSVSVGELPFYSISCKVSKRVLLDLICNELYDILGGICSREDILLSILCYKPYRVGCYSSRYIYPVGVSCADSYSVGRVLDSVAGSSSALLRNVGYYGKRRNCGDIEVLFYVVIEEVI